ncbi:uncharacterized protein LOC122836664 [Gambusia affinis]|uniref:uncharacterized protein LOC122836664 n=1 Tax=Gambusia affinis TaxID=33528 RepID=UPI001CDC5E7B|nr:uncharacterized protein LOC122836664 [Gambusia affinis]XP_043982337.1 uncharacterized protein LOC122836664 [Gambusia affinis]
MITVKLLLRVSLFCLLLLLDVYGSPVKGSKSQGQGRPSDSGGDHGVYHATGYSASGSYRPSGSVSKPVAKHLAQPQYVLAQPVPLGRPSSVPIAGYTASSGSLVQQGGSVVGSHLPTLAGSRHLVPLPAVYASSPPQPGTQANLHKMQWAIAPQAFEEATRNTQPQGLSIVGPPLPPALSALALQSGDTSNVVKEAKIGNYQQPIEEFGYPSDRVGPGLGLPPVALPASGVGGLWGFPPPYTFPCPFHYLYPGFDYRLLYGLYPPGTYTTLSKYHEKGKDYQKEHGSDAPQSPGSQQQQRLKMPL